MFTRVPMIARWPGKIQTGQVNHQPFALWDFLPTLTEIANVVAPEGSFTLVGFSLAIAQFR